MTSLRGRAGPAGLCGAAGHARLMPMLEAALQTVLGGACGCIARLTRRDIVRLAGTGARVRVDPFTGVGRELMRFSQRRAESFMLPLMKHVLRRDDTFIDVGAHWGVYSMAAAWLVGPGGLVIAVEPSPHTYRRLLQNVELNRFANVVAWGCAVGEREEPARLCPGGSGGNLTRVVAAAAACETGTRANEHCQMVRLQALLRDQGIGEARMVKIDIEGGEYPLVNDLSDYMSMFHAVMMEVHPAAGNIERDAGVLYRCLGAGRRLYAVDGERRSLAAVESVESFAAAMPRYYFISFRRDAPGLTDANMWRQFTWESAEPTGAGSS